MKFCWKAGCSATGEQQLPAKDGQADRLTGPTAKDIATAQAPLQSSMKPGRAWTCIHLLRANQPMGGLADAVMLQLSISLASALSGLKLFIHFLRNCN